VTDLRTGEHLLAEPHAGALCTGRFSLTNTSRDRCARTRTSFPGCRRRAAAWKVCLGGADRHPCRNNKSCRTGCRPVRSGIAFRGTTERIACVFDNTSRPRACEGTWWCRVSRCAVLGPRCGSVPASSVRARAALPVRVRPRGWCAPSAVRGGSLAQARVGEGQHRRGVGRSCCSADGADNKFPSLLGRGWGRVKSHRRCRELPR